MLKFQETVKKEVKFPAVIKKKSCGISISLVFRLGISKEYQNILWYILRWSFAFSRISKGKVTNLKSPGFFQKSMSSTLQLDAYIESYSF